MRRALRIGPAYLVMLCLTIPLMFLSLRHKLQVSIFTAVSTSLLYVANWAQVVRPQSTGPLIHTWSLAIEEQFYLIWPLVLLLLLRGGRSRDSIARLVVGLIIMTSLVTAALSIWLEPVRLNLVSTTQGVGLLIGAYLALRPVRCPPWAAWSSAGLLAMVFLTVGVDSIWLDRGGYLLVDLAAGLLVAHAVQGHGALNAALRWRVFRGLGLASYGLYLYHYPVFMLAQDSDWPGWQQRSFELFATGILTLVSFFAIERPALRLKGHRWVTL